MIIIQNISDETPQKKTLSTIIITKKRKTEMRKRTWNGKDEFFFSFIYFESRE